MDYYGDQGCVRCLLFYVACYLYGERYKHYGIRIDVAVILLRATRGHLFDNKRSTVMKFITRIFLELAHKIFEYINAVPIHHNVAHIHTLAEADSGSTMWQIRSMMAHVVNVRANYYYCLLSRSYMISNQ